MSIKMPILVDVQCSNCGEMDQVYWGEYGAESACPICDSAPIDLFRINDYEAK